MSKPPSILVAEGVSLPADAVVTEKIGWLGRTGSGKTYGAMQMAEQMLDAGVQVLALDPIGVWAGLRMEGPAWPVYVLGGLYGDVPLDPTHGAAVAELVTREGISAVLDVSQFETGADVTRFAEAFATGLYAAKKRAPSALHLFVEEAQEFVPQNPDPGETRMLRAFERLWKLGRNFGIGGSLISQRPQEINKKALNQAGLLFVFQLTGPQERKAVDFWMSNHVVEGSAAGLPSLKRGQPYLWGPDLGISKVVTIPAKRSRDVSRTPLVGERTRRGELTRVDVEGLREALVALTGPGPEAVAEAADADENDRLQALIDRLQAEQATLQRAYDDLHATHAQLRGQLRSFVAGLGEVLRDTGEDIRTTPRTWDQPLPRETVTFPANGVIHHGTETFPAEAGDRIAATITSKGTTIQRIPRGAAGISTTAYKLLVTFVTYGGVLDDQRLRLLSGYRPSGSYARALAELRAKGFMDRGATGAFEITALGRKQVSPSDVAQLPRGRTALVSFWTQKLGTTEGRILQALVNEGPMPEPTLLKHLQYRPSGSWARAKARLRAAGLLDKRRDGALVSSI